MLRTQPVVSALLAAMAVGSLGGRGAAPADADSGATSQASTTAPDRPKAAPLDLAESDRKIKEFEGIVDRYYRRGPMADVEASVNRLVDEYNAWNEKTVTEFNAQQKQLKGQLQELRRIEAAIAEANRRISRLKGNRGDAASVKAYNQAVAERNELARKYESLRTRYRAGMAANRSQSDRIDRETEARKRRVDAAKRDAERAFKAYREWVKAGKDRPFWTELNELYGRLHERKRQPGETARVEVQLWKLKALRTELAAFAAKRRAKDENNLIVVPAKLGSEPCLMAVDTGATSMTISPAIVEAMGLSDRLGEEVRMRLVGGIEIKLRKLTIPRMSVFGNEARDVAAVVLEEPDVGIDGLLGLSFLNRFNYRIDKAGDPKLTLKPREN